MEERGLVDRGTCVLAACSGGADSGAMLVVLARLASDLGFSLCAASVDHRLRPGSERDVDAARAQAEALGVPFDALAVQVTPGASLQARARDERYAALLVCARKRGAARVAVGHTRDDQAETVVMRILRGAGIAGLAGITPRRTDGVVRPLIDCDRAEVHAFAREHCPTIAWDDSNRDARFERVRVRETVLPALRLEDPAVVGHLAELADDARELWEALAPAATEVLAEAREDLETIRVSVLCAEPPAVRRFALRLWVHAVTGGLLGRAQLDQVEHCLSRGGEIWLGDRWRVVIDARVARLGRRVSDAP